MSPSSRLLARSAGRRLAGTVLVLWAAVTAVFLGTRAMPGSVEDVVLGVQAGRPGLREQVRAQLGLDRPLLTQYTDYVGGLLRGDFGRSYVLRADVSDVIGAQLAPTLQLALWSVALAAALVWLVAVTTGRSARTRRTVSALELLAVCLPTFWVGTQLIDTFSFDLRWLPSSGAGGWETLVLPTVTLALPVAGILSQFMREEIGRQLRQPHVTTARGRGISRLRLNAVHLVPHAAVSSLTVAGNLLGALLGGAVVVETVFSRPGLGRTALSAVESQDTPLILAVVLIVAAAYVVISTLVDLLALAIDPRLRENPS